MVEFDHDTHTYTCGGERFPSVTQVLADLGFYGDAVKYFTDYKRDLGSFAHKAIRRVELTFREDGRYLQSMDIEELSGDRTWMTFTNTVLNAPLDARA